MGQPSSRDEMTIRHQFDRLCQMALKGEAANYYKHMEYRRKHEVTFSELSEKELSKLFTMDEYGTEYHHFEVHGYDIEVKNTLIAEALKGLTERKRNVILLSYFMEMSDADIARETVKSAYGKKIKVFDTEIPHSIRAVEATAEGKSIFAYDKSGKVAAAYEQLGKEVAEIGEKQRNQNRADRIR